MRILALVMSFTLGLAVRVSAQPAGYFEWSVQIGKSDRVTTATSLTVAMYGPQDTLQLKWLFRNDEGIDTISITPSTFQGAVRIDEQADQTLSTLDMQWLPTGHLVPSSSQVPVPIGAAGTYELAPGDSILWEAHVRRKTGDRWTPGEYHLVIDMRQALATLLSSGTPWRGRSPGEGEIAVRISALNTVASRKAARRMAGADALAAGNSRSAVEQYRALVKEDPQDLASYAHLGHALLEAGDYRGAIVALETALPRVLGEKSAVPERLAYAYLLVGDETNAVRILRMTGRDGDVAARLARLRSAARRR